MFRLNSKHLLEESGSESFNTSDVSVEFMKVGALVLGAVGFNTSDVSVELYLTKDFQELYNSFNTSDVSVEFNYDERDEGDPQVSILQMFRLNATGKYVMVLKVIKFQYFRCFG